MCFTIARLFRLVTHGMGCIVTSPTDSGVTPGEYTGVLGSHVVDPLTQRRPSQQSPTPSGDPPTLTILHFNDVYHIQPHKKEPVGGAARFVTMIKDYQKQWDSLIMFSGDIFNPSLLSTLTKYLPCFCSSELYPTLTFLSPYPTRNVSPMPKEVLTKARGQAQGIGTAGSHITRQDMSGAAVIHPCPSPMPPRPPPSPHTFTQNHSMEARLHTTPPSASNRKSQLANPPQ